MKKLFFCILLLFLSFNLFAQTDQVAKDVASLVKNSQTKAVADSGKHWKFSGMFSLSASDTYLKNWANGGDQQVGCNTLLNLNAGYRKNRHSWQNNFVASYGMQRLVDQTEDFRKTDDKLEFASKYGYAATRNLYYSAIFNYKSQSAKGYTYDDNKATKTLNSECWSPLYVTYTIGLDYQPRENLAFYFSPFCGKTTVVLNDSLSSIGAFGVDSLSHSRSEFGFYFKLDTKFDLCKNVSLQTNATFFNSYRDGIFDETDIDWNVIISMQINKFLSFNITSELIYDEDILIDDTYSLTQLKNITGLGLTFKF